MPFFKKLFYAFNIFYLKILGKPMYSIEKLIKFKVDADGKEIPDTITVKYCVINNASQEVEQCFDSFKEAQTFRDELQNKPSPPRHKFW